VINSESADVKHEHNNKSYELDYAMLGLSKEESPTMQAIALELET